MGSDEESQDALLVAGLIGVVAGFALDPWIPVIKRICTPSFVIASGGFALMALAFSYLIIDVVKLRKGIKFFAIVGMNPLFIYIFAIIGGNQLIAKNIQAICTCFFRLGRNIGHRNSLIITGMVLLVVHLLFPLQTKDFYSSLINCTFDADSNKLIACVRKSKEISHQPA